MNETDITGRRYGRLTALYRDGLSKDWQPMWLCRCDCGKEVRVYKCNLVAGRTRSCGCLRSELVTERNRRRHGSAVGHTEHEK